MVSMPRLSSLTIYPIKSASGIACQTAVLTPQGLQFDRRWMVASSDGQFMTQRRFPKMATISVACEGEQMKVSAPDMPLLSVPMQLVAGDEREVEVWGDRTTALSAGLEAHAWFSQFLSTPCQLVYMPETTQRPVDHGKFGIEKIVSFADAYPYLLLSDASLRALNQKLAAQNLVPVPMNRFRPNLVVDGDIAPHAEDNWKKIRIGKAVFEVAKPCARCSIPNVDQASGDRTLEPTKTLAIYRAWDKAIWFGQNLVEVPDTSHLSTLTVGDDVEVLA